MDDKTWWIKSYSSLFFPPGKKKAGKKKAGFTRKLNPGS